MRIHIDDTATGEAGKSLDFREERGCQCADVVIVCHQQLAGAEAVDGIWGAQQGVRERFDVLCRGISGRYLEEIEGVS